MPSTDTFIEKDSSINEEIERLRLAATGSLISRNDVIVIASVSCIYGLGSPDDFRALSVEVQTPNSSTVTNCSFNLLRHCITGTI